MASALQCPSSPQSQSSKQSISHLEDKYACFYKFSLSLHVCFISLHNLLNIQTILWTTVITSTLTLLEYILAFHAPPPKHTKLLDILIFSCIHSLNFVCHSIVTLTIYIERSRIGVDIQFSETQVLGLASIQCCFL